MAGIQGGEGVHSEVPEVNAIGSPYEVTRDVKKVGDVALRMSALVEVVRENNAKLLASLKRRVTV